MARFFRRGSTTTAIYIDESQLIRIEKALDVTAREARPVLREAINKTARDAQKKLIDRAREVYLYKKGLAKKDLVLTRATNTNLVAKLQASGAGTELYHFSAKGPVAWNETIPGAPATRGHAVRNTSMTSLVNQNIKAFIARMPSGHTTIVRRSPDWMGKNSSLGERYLQTILTVSVPGMIGDEERVWNYVSPELGRTLNEEVTKAINRRLP